MRNLIWRAVTLVLCACLGFTLFAPAASAQDGEVTVINGECFTNTPTSVINIIEAEVEVAAEYPLSATRQVQRIGEEVIENVLTQVPCTPPLTLPEEVSGKVVAIIAVGGSNVDLPVALGASLIGVGGLFVAAARKRRNEFS